jgi:hypothetical protein
MRRAAAGFAAVFLVGLVALLVVGATRGSALVYSPGVSAVNPIELPAGKRACQAPLTPPDGAAFDRVAFAVGTHRRPGEPIRVDVRDDRDGSMLASGRLPGGYGDLDVVPEHVVEVGRVETEAPLRICLVNQGRRKVAILGQAGAASSRTAATVAGEPSPYDLAVRLRRQERSLLALLPTMAERASLFRAGWISPAVYAVLALLIVVAAPLLLARGIARAARADAGG